MNDEKVRDYLDDVLSMDPREHAAAILERRDRFLGRATAAATTQLRQAPHEQGVDRSDRENSRKKLDSLRRQFWKMQPGHFEIQASKLPLESFPDLREERNRLLQVNDLRGAIRALTVSKDVDADFVARFQRLVVASPRDASAEKDKILQALHEGRHAKLVKTVKRIRKRFPDLYALEPDWLESLIQANDHRKWTRKRSAQANQGVSSSTGEDSSLSSVIVVVVWIALIKGAVYVISQIASK